MVRLARENSDWGYDRIVGALANLGHTVSDQTVGNILRRQGIAPAPVRKRTTTWSQFIRSHMAVLAGTDFFTVEVLTWRGLVTYYVLFFLHLETRRVTIAGITDQPEQSWMQPMARHATLEAEGWLSLPKIRYWLHDRDTKSCASFRQAAGSWRREEPAASCAESEPEFVRGALSTDGEGRVPVEADSVRGRFVAAGTARIRSALSRRTQPPRQGQRSVNPMWRSADDEARAIDPLSRTPRRSSQVLPPKGRMSFLIIASLKRIFTLSYRIFCRRIPLRGF